MHVPCCICTLAISVYWLSPMHERGLCVLLLTVLPAARTTLSVPRRMSSWWRRSTWASSQCWRSGTTTRKWTGRSVSECLYQGLWTQGPANGCLRMRLCLAGPTACPSPGSSNAPTPAASLPHTRVTLATNMQAPSTSSGWPVTPCRFLIILPHCLNNLLPLPLLLRFQGCRSCLAPGAHRGLACRVLPQVPLP